MSIHGLTPRSLVVGGRKRVGNQGRMEGQEGSSLLLPRKQWLAMGMPPALKPWMTAVRVRVIAAALSMKINSTSLTL